MVLAGSKSKKSHVTGTKIKTKKLPLLLKTHKKQTHKTKPALAS